MAQRKKSEIEFIQDTFCPQVAVLCSYDAEVVCRKNSLTFVELVQPFCRFNGEIKISDPSNNLCTISNLRVEIKDINSIPPQPVLAKKLLDDAVSSGLSAAQHIIEKQILLNNYNFVANINTPWFESWRECFIKIGYPDEHEFLKHFLACIFVVSTGHLDPLDQFQKLIQQQQQIQQIAQNSSPKWFFPNVQSVFKYFVLLHDVQEGEISKAHQIYENLKNVYGSSNCHLLQINSKQPMSMQQQQQSMTEFDPWLQYCKFNDLYNNQISMVNDQMDQILEDSSDISQISQSNENLISNPLISNTLNKSSQNGSVPVKRHGMCLALSDHDRIKTLISEFLQRGLVPYVERYIKILNEQIQSKKSILKSIGFPRRIFGGSSSSSSMKPSPSSSSVVSITASGLSNVNQSPSSNSSITITSNSTFAGSNDELQIRRLADLAFMFRLYDLAYNSYHTCKKEFTSFINNSSNQSNTEQLLNMTLYLAGALEMASISNFMQNFSSDPHYSSILHSTSSSNMSSLQQSSPSTSIVSPSVSSSSSSFKTYNYSYIDEAIHLLLNTCKNNYFATRCALLNTEALKTINQFNKAAYQFISLSSDESDMRSALFLEQAAQCFLAIQSPQPSIRKYAFYMSIAGYRFNKAGQKKHAIRVYKHALEIYENRCWHKAQDHLNFVMSRLNFNLRNIQEALSHIESILIKKKIPQKPSSYQTSLIVPDSSVNIKSFTKIVEFANETSILKDFILYSNTLINESKNKITSLPQIPVPLIESNQIKVNSCPVDGFTLKHGQVLVHNDSDFEYSKDPISQKEKDLLNSLNNRSNSDVSIDLKQLNELKDMWFKYEQALYTSAYRTAVPILFKPHLTYFDQYTDNRQAPKLVVNETCAVMFEIRNHLRINLIVSDLTLLWKYVTDDSEPESITNEMSFKDDETIVECSTLKELNLTPYETYKLRLYLIPKRSNGTLTILGIKYRLGLTSFLPNSTASSTSLNSLTSQLSNATISENNNNISNNETLTVKQLFEIKGPRLNNNSANMRSVVYDIDQRLTFKILNPTPQLQIEMKTLPTTLYCDQLEKVRVYFINLSSKDSIGNIKIASNGIASSKICFRQVDQNENKLQLNKLESMKKSEFKFKELDNEKTFKQQFTNNSEIQSSSDLVFSLDEVCIGPNGLYELDMWIRGPCEPGEHKFYFMFFYQEMDQLIKNGNIFKYRIIRYEFSVQTFMSLAINSVNVINSSFSSNIILNIEALNYQNNQSSIELMDSISVSDIWQTKPVKRSKSLTNSEQQEQRAPIPSNEDILSFSLQAQEVENRNRDNKVYFFRSACSEKNRDSIPNQDVLYHFIRLDLKNRFLSRVSEESSFLNVYLLWKSISTENLNEPPTTLYSLSVVNVVNELTESIGSLKNSDNIQKLEYRIPTESLLIDNNRVLRIKNILKYFLAITSSCKSEIRNDFTIKKFCQLVLNIELKNLSNKLEFDLIIMARNNLKKNINDNEKSYVWLGCTKKYVHLEPNQIKQIKFKIGFYSNGVFEIGSKSNKYMSGDFKLNLFDSTATSLNINTNNNVAIVLDDINDTFKSEIETNKSSNNPVLSSSNLPSPDSTAGCICIFNKNTVTNHYELFKCLNTFTVTIK